jgi:signal peptidase I
MDPTAFHPVTPAAVSASVPLERRLAGPVIALFFGPLGHIAIGRWRRACGWYGAEVALTAAMFVGAFLGTPRLLWLAIAATFLIRIAMIADVRRLARVQPLPSRGIVLIVAIGVAIFYDILGIRVRTSFIEAFSIPSASMYPSLEVGDHLFVKKTSRDLHRGDVVVFAFPQDHKVDYIKRIVALGGDVIGLHDGQLTINGRFVERRRLDEPCAGTQGGCTLWEESLDGRRWRVALQDRAWSHDFEPTTVPEGQYFVLGDNRDNSSDSRVWGPVAADLVKGKASFIYWSWDAAHAIRWDRIDQPVR